MTRARGGRKVVDAERVATDRRIRHREDGVSGIGRLGGRWCGSKDYWTVFEVATASSFCKSADGSCFTRNVDCPIVTSETFSIATAPPRRSKPLVAAAESLSKSVFGIDPVDPRPVCVFGPPPVAGGCSTVVCLLDSVKGAPQIMGQRLLAHLAERPFA